MVELQCTSQHGFPAFRWLHQKSTAHRQCFGGVKWVERGSWPLMKLYGLWLKVAGSAFDLFCFAMLKEHYISGPDSSHSNQLELVGLDVPCFSIKVLSVISVDLPIQECVSMYKGWGPWMERVSNFSTVACKCINTPWTFFTFRHIMTTNLSIFYWNRMWNTYTKWHTTLKYKES